MLPEQLDRLRPSCPACRIAGREPEPLALGTVAREDGGDIREGVLVCPEAACRREHPIIDGIPVVVADLAGWAAHQLDSVLRREDLSPFLQTLIGDAAGPGSAYDRDRLHVSGYAHAHYDEGGGFPSVVDAAIGLLDPPAVDGLWIDTGCATGGATVELARRGAELAVGVDLSFAVLRAAERVRREGRARYALRRVGLAYDERDVDVPGVAPDRIAYWCADVAALPFGDGAFAGALSLNVLDCVPSPLGHLLELGRVLAPGTSALLCTPYDWSSAATGPDQWIGGHSQRGGSEGSSVAELRRVLSGDAGVETGLRVVAERDGVYWRVRSHERASVEYALDLLRLERA